MSDEDVSCLANSISARISYYAATDFTRLVSERVKSQAAGHVYEKVMSLVKDAVLAELQSQLYEYSKNYLEEDAALQPLLPDGVKFCRRGQHKSLILVVEQKPQTRSLFFTDLFLEAKELSTAEIMASSGRAAAKTVGRRHMLPLPYVVFLFQLNSDRALDGLWVYFRPEPLRSLNDRLYSACVPNVHPDTQAACLNWGPSAGDVKKVVDETISYFWASTFNVDYSNAYFKMVRRDEAFFLPNWRNMDPTYVLGAKYEPLGVLRQVVDKFCARGAADKPAMEIVDRVASKMIAAVPAAVKAAMNMVVIEQPPSEFVLTACKQALQEVSRMKSAEISELIFE